MNAPGELRRWLRIASTSERITTLGVALVLLVLVGAALVPAPARRGGGTATMPQHSANEAARRGVDASPGAPTSTLQASVDATPATASPGARPRDTGGPRTSHRTSAPIKLGFTSISVNTAQVVFGYEPNFRKDAPQAIDAYVDYANKHGGVAGRRIDAVTVKPDFVMADDQRTKCIELTETHDVFAVIDSFAFTASTSTACVTAEHHTLLVSANPLGSEHVRAEAPHHVSLFKDDNRKMKDLVAAAQAAGFFDPARGFRRLAVLDTNCVPSILDSPIDGLFRYLRAAGVKWTEFRMECAAARARDNAQRAILQMRNDDVTHVLLVLNPPNFKTYLDEAATAGFRAKYFASGWAFAVVGGLTDEYNASVFDGALAVTETRAGEGLSPLATKCSGILTDRGLRAVDPYDAYGISDDVEVLELCENFFLFLDAATRARGDLTTTSWLEALPHVGDFRGAVVDLARLDPSRGKLTGGDTTKLVQWRAGCRCWSHLTDFEPAAG